MKRRKTKSAVREYAESILIAVVLALLMRQFVVQAFKIPSGSMEQTLLIGDHILVNKFLYRFATPQRFDIIVFKYPWGDGRDFIKRVIGLPGERVQIRDRRVYINGVPLVEPYARYSAWHRNEDNFGPVVVPKKGDVLEIRADGRLYRNGEPIPVPEGRFYPEDYGAAMSGFEVFYGPLFPPGTSLQRPAGPVTVAHDYYFMLGDNRDNSKDSRYWGFVADNLIKGKAFMIYWSWNRRGRLLQHVRWHRLGKLLELMPSGSLAGQQTSQLLGQLHELRHGQLLRPHQGRQVQGGPQRLELRSGERPLRNGQQVGAQRLAPVGKGTAHHLPEKALVVTRPRQNRIGNQLYHGGINGRHRSKRAA
ncbi:MAG: hypothetical protein KatS3mg131_0803 [Candidatus Tectimicrobiota bacterium]|nr:MAG: hypothetical protein KatS3mg131_0803 [Candidatus Tectomicrobia bacterium]